ncbi:unnamed protein product [Ophioblennius macclurei]
MGGNGSAARTVSFGLDEEEKVTVIEGVKLSSHVLRRMRDSPGSDNAKPPPQSSEHAKKPPPRSKPTGPSASEINEEMRKQFERQQALVREQLAGLAQRERDAAATTGLNEMTPALIMEKGRSHEEQEKAKILARQLERKEQELTSVSSFYKEQLEILEKKNFDIYKGAAEQYNQAATKAEAQIRPRQNVILCAELQAKVLECYRGNPRQTLHCSSLAKQYMTCVHQAKKGSLTNHG